MQLFSGDLLLHYYMVGTELDVITLWKSLQEDSREDFLV